MSNLELYINVCKSNDSLSTDSDAPTQDITVTRIKYFRTSKTSKSMHRICSFDEIEQQLFVALFLKREHQLQCVKMRDNAN